jgi:hypothetical protein
MAFNQGESESQRELEIQEEYKIRHDLDFDDVDETHHSWLEGISPTFSPPAPGTTLSPMATPTYTRGGTEDIHRRLEHLDQAEELNEQLSSGKTRYGVKSRLGRKKEDNQAAIEDIAEFLTNTQQRMADIISKNKDLKQSITNPQRFAAALTLELIPNSSKQSGSESVLLLKKLTTTLENLKKAKSKTELFALLKLPPNIFTKKYKRNSHYSKTFPKKAAGALERAELCSSNTPERQEKAVRHFFNLAASSVTKDLLKQNGLGKKVRKMENHPVQAVAKASAVVLQAWKQTLIEEHPVKIK